MSKPDLRIGVVGAGAIAQLAHLPVLAKMRGVKLVALCDNDSAKVRALVASQNAFSEQKAVRELIPKSGSVFDANRMIL